MCYDKAFIFIVWILWYSVSSVSTLTNKSLLLVFGYPLTATINQLVHTAVLGYLLSTLSGYSTLREILGEVKAELKSFFALGFLNALSIALFHFGMAMLSAAYIHTIKTSVPIFVVATSCFLGKRYSFKTYIALLVILSGVMIASKTEMSLTSEGLIISLSSAMGTAVFSIYMKMVLTSSSLHASDIMFVVASTSVFCIFPVWAFVDLRRMICTDGTQLLTQFKKVAYLLFLDGVARCLQNLVAIVMLSHLTALGYSVASVMKRFVVILTAIVFFATPVSGMTFFGLGLAMTGLLLYNLSKDGQSSDPSQNSELEQTDENVSMKRVRIDAFSKNHQPIRNLA